MSNDTWDKYEAGIYCVECGQTYDETEFLKYVKYFKHCPNCGRKVQGGVPNE
jgi:DNA-directed RNA polymerase subunit RPC12/RpoP